MKGETVVQTAEYRIKHASEHHLSVIASLHAIANTGGRALGVVGVWLERRERPLSGLNRKANILYIIILNQ
jgi:hypothetical protein